jgi:putative sterol carrier protein
VALFPSAEWLGLYVGKIQESEAWSAAAATWEGDLSYVIEAEPDKNIPENVWYWMDLWRGECRGGKETTAEEGTKARFIIRAPYSRWKQVITGELDPVKGMLQGKLKLKGNLPAIIRHVKAANELVAIAGTVPTEFIDERKG